MSLSTLPLPPPPLTSVLGKLHSIPLSIHISSREGSCLYLYEAKCSLNNDFYYSQISSLELNLVQLNLATVADKRGYSFFKNNPLVQG